VQNILQFHGKILVNLGTETLNKFEGTYKRNNIDSSSKYSKTEEEKLKKRKNTKALNKNKNK
jgi:hypothetical protein